MRRHCAAALVTLALAGNGECAAAQDSYPNRPIHIVIPFPAGGPADIAARIIGQKMSEEWGQPVVVDNRPGGNTIIGAEIRRQGRARRLHADDGNRFDAGDESVSLQKPALRSAQRFRPDHDDREIDVAPRRASGQRAEDRERADRARQGRARQAQFRRRHDHRAAHGRACSTRPPASMWSMYRSKAPSRQCKACSPARPTWSMPAMS